MKTLHLDLHENATRASIACQLGALLDVGQREGVGYALAASGIVAESHHHDLSAVLAAIEASGLERRTREDASEVYRILAGAESRVHGVPVRHTHFHEVGDGAAVFSVLTICEMVRLLEPSEIVATPVQVGSGMVSCAHGLLPIPAPATAAILMHEVPLCSHRLEGELCTPTSAAVIVHFVDRFEEEG